MKANDGFTLIELMVTVAIVGILATIALPSYSAYVTRGKTTEATSALAGLRVAMEQCYQDNRTYVGCFVAPAPDDFAYAEGVPATATTAAVVTTATTYLLTATGAGSMAGYAYTIDQANAKTSTINGVAYACWVASPGSAC